MVHALHCPSLPYRRCLSIVQDMEPEFIAVTENGNTAYVTLQVRKGYSILLTERAHNLREERSTSGAARLPCGIRTGCVATCVGHGYATAASHDRSPRVPEPPRSNLALTWLPASTGEQRRGEDRHQGLPDQAHVPSRIQGMVMNEGVTSRQPGPAHVSVGHPFTPVRGAHSRRSYLCGLFHPPPGRSASTKALPTCFVLAGRKVRSAVNGTIGAQLFIALLAAGAIIFLCRNGAATWRSMLRTRTAPTKRG